MTNNLEHERNPLDYPPPGAWFETRGDTTKASSVLRGWITVAVIFFSMIWSIGSIVGFCMSAGQMHGLKLLLFGFLSFGGTIFLYSISLLHLVGKLVIESDGKRCRYSHCAGPIRLGKSFDWSDIDSIEIEEVYNFVLKGRRRVRIPVGLPKERRYFIFCALLYMQVEAEQLAAEAEQLPYEIP